jgi:GalNAc-alpha-(1->4)-GalNAc-alpha-(1->3)-diNAcBac-PP-undecaprenol alpha-1,4-N-acetyl-D-galactosaminyltransferase
VNIAFVIPGLGPGGAERVATLLCNFWAGEGHAVTVITFEGDEAAPFYPVDQRVAVRRLAASAGSGSARLLNNINRVSRLRALLWKLHPDVVVAFTTDANVISLLASRGSGIPVVISERNQPDRPGLASVHRLARRITYPLADAVVAQTDAVAAWMRKHFRVPVHIVPNPVRVPNSNSPRIASDQPLLIAVGRLTAQKGFDILIEAFARVAAKHRDWRLVIYGEGPARTELESLRDALSLQGRLSLPGLTRNVETAFAEASLFVLPSRFEGYPNALLEALAAGLPVIATSAPGGASEILEDGKYGLLVAPGDAVALASALDTMMADPELRERYAKCASRAVTELDLQFVGRRWLDLLATLRT